MSDFLERNGQRDMTTLFKNGAEKLLERDVISRIENGGRFVVDFEVVVIADVLEVSVDWLLGKE